MAENPLAVGDVVEARTVWWMDNQLGVNTFHWQVSAVVNATIEGVLSAFEGATGLAVGSLASANAEYRGMQFRRVQPNPTAMFVSKEAMPANGGLPGTDLPTQVSTIVKKRTAHAGPTGRGRNYFPFPTTHLLGTEGNVDLAVAGPIFDGTIKPALFEPMVVIDFQTNDGVVFEPGVWSRRTTAFHPITQTELNEYFATQRKRGDFGKQNPKPVL